MNNIQVSQVIQNIQDIRRKKNLGKTPKKYKEMARKFIGFDMFSVGVLMQSVFNGGKLCRFFKLTQFRDH